MPFRQAFYLGSNYLCGVDERCLESRITALLVLRRHRCLSLITDCDSLCGRTLGLPTAVRHHLVVHSAERHAEYLGGACLIVTRIFQRQAEVSFFNLIHASAD